MQVSLRERDLDAGPASARAIATVSSLCVVPAVSSWPDQAYSSNSSEFSAKRRNTACGGGAASTCGWVLAVLRAGRSRARGRCRTPRRPSRRCAACGRKRPVHHAIRDQAGVGDDHLRAFRRAERGRADADASDFADGAPTSMVSPGWTGRSKSRIRPETKLFTTFWRPKPMPTPKAPASSDNFYRSSPRPSREQAPQHQHRVVDSGGDRVAHPAPAGSRGITSSSRMKRSNRESTNVPAR